MGLDGHAPTVAAAATDVAANQRGVWWVFSVALVLRVLAAGFGGPITPDGVYFYLPSAAGILDGDLLRGVPPTHHPGYPFLIAVFQLLGFAPEWAGRAVSVLAGSLTVFPVWLLARRLLGSRWGLYCAVLLAILPIHVKYSGWVQTEALFGLLVALALDRLVAYARGGSAACLWLASLWVAAGVWVRGEALLMIPLFGVAALCRPHECRRWWGVMVAMGCVAASAATTGLLTMEALGGRFAYSPGSAIVFVLGQQQGEHPFDCFFEIAESGEHLEFYYATTAQGFDPRLKERYIQEDPIGFALHTARKWWRLVVRLAPKGTGKVWFIFCYLGLLLLMRRWRGDGGGLLSLHFGVTMAGLSAYFVQDRFWVPLVAVSAVATATGVRWVAETLARRWRPMLWLLPLGVALTALPSTFKVYSVDSGWNARHPREIAAALQKQCSLQENDHVMALEAHWLYYAGVETSELPVADWAATEHYARQRGITGVLISADGGDPRHRSWAQQWDPSRAQTVILDSRQYHYLPIAP